MSQIYSQLPLSFEANRGQTDAQAKFVSRGSGYSLFLTSTEAVLSLSQPAISAARKETLGAHKLKERRTAKQQRAVLRMKLAGANPSPQMEGLDELRGKSNYFIGNDPKQWRTDVPNYAKVRYRNVYPGVDLVYYGNQQQLEYDLVVAPGTDPNVIKLAFAGARQMRMDANGDLLLRTAGGEIRQHKPVIYQNVNGVRKEIAGRYVVRNQREVGFEVANYDASHPLVIDPVLAYSTFMGGNNHDYGYGIAADNAGNAYVTGATGSSDFPTKDSIQTYHPNTYDVFVAKIDTNKSGADSLVYSTLLGGDSYDSGYGIAVDNAGNAYVTGATDSSNFPTKNPYPHLCCGSAYFVTKLNAAGNGLNYSTYLGGRSLPPNFVDGGIAVDEAGNAYVTGGGIIPLKNAYQAFVKGRDEAFLVRLDTNKSGTDSLIYGTLLGSSGDDVGYGIAVDNTGNAYVTGVTSAGDFPTKNQYQDYQNGDTGRDAFLAKIDTNKSGAASLVYSTFLGGNRDDYGYAVAVDSAGNAYVTGWTFSSNFPTKNPYQTMGSLFVTKIDTNQSGADSLVYSTYLSAGPGTGIAVDATGNIYVTGVGSALPITPGAFQCGGGGFIGFVAKLNATGTALLFSTCLGSGDDYGSGIAVDNIGNVYVTGYIDSGSIHFKNGYQPNKSAGNDAFLTKFASAPDLAITEIRGTSFFVAGRTETYNLTVTNTGLIPTNGVITVTDLLPNGLSFASATGAGWVCSASGQMVTCTYADPIAPAASVALTLSVKASSAAVPSVTNTVSVSVIDDFDPTNNSASDTAAVFCPYSIEPASKSFGMEGGNGSVTVTSAGGCGWTATSNASWILLTAGSSGSGNGTVSYLVAANPGVTPRTGTITIADQTSTVTQLGATFTISGRVTFAGNGLSGVTLTLSGWYSGTTQTDSNGNYSFTNLPATGSFITITPTKTNYNFSPQSRTFNNFLANQTANFAATIPVVSVSAASYSAAGLAAGSIASAFGANLAEVTQPATTLPLPTELGGATVSISDSRGTVRDAPLLFVSPGQINFYVPPGTATGTATITIINVLGGLISTGTVQISTVAPGLFTGNSDGQGVPAAVAVRLSAGNSQSFEPVAQFDAGQNKFVPRPLDLGPDTDQVFLELFGTGIRFRTALSAVRITIGGVNAEVQYAGAQGDFAGLDQLNVRVPRSLIGRGEVALVLTVDGQMANTVLINIK